MKKLKEHQCGITQTLIVAALTVVFVTCGCKKSERETAEENALKRHQQEVTRSPAVTPAARAAWSNYFRTPEGMRITSEFDFLKSLKTNGQLPGVSKDTKGMFRMEKKPSEFTSQGGYTHEIHFFTQAQPPQNYYYVIGQVSSNNQLQLMKAWHVDQSGNVDREYPVQ